MAATLSSQPESSNLLLIFVCGCIHIVKLLKWARLRTGYHKSSGFVNILSVVLL